jgi:apolipoprotein N-acyltransferase
MDIHGMKPNVFLPSIVSGILLWTAFFPLNLGPVAFFALAPFLTLVRAEGVTRRRRYLAAYTGGVVFFLLAMQWVRVAHPMMYISWGVMTFFAASFWPFTLALLRLLDSRKPLLVFSAPLAFVAVEYFRAHFPAGYPFLKPLGLYQMSGFGWYFLGYTQHAFTMFTQIADVGGVYAVSAIVAMTNGALAEWLIRVPVVRRWLNWPVLPADTIGFSRQFRAVAAATLAVVLVIGYGLIRLQHKPFEVGPRVALIQADVEQSDKMQDLSGLFQRYDNLCRNASARADLVVWPETCYPYGWFTIAKGQENNAPPEFKDSVAKCREDLRRDMLGHTRNGEKVPGWNTNVLLGLNGYEWDGQREVPSNTALLVDRNGTEAGRYDKLHLVPFGEYVPFRQTMPFLQWFTPYTHDYSCRPGDKFVRMPIMVGDTQYTFGVLICYEDSDPYLARQYSRQLGDEAPVNFLVNMSNDGWFRGSEEHEQHLAICRFRAIEARRTVVRAVNMGISAVIDSDGRVMDLPAGTWEASKKVDAVLSLKIPIDARESLYAELGDWLPATCWVMVLAAWIRNRWRQS